MAIGRMRRHDVPAEQQAAPTCIDRSRSYALQALDGILLAEYGAENVAAYLTAPSTA